MSRRTPGMPIPGTERTVSAGEIAAALGLTPGSGPKEGADVPLTPAQARKVMSDEYPGETPDIGWETVTIKAGRDVMDALGVDPAKLPVGAEAQLGPPQPRPERRPREGGAEARKETPADTAAEEQAERIREYARADADRAQARVKAAMESGSAEERERAIEDGRATVEFVKKVRDKIGL